MTMLVPSALEDFDAVVHRYLRDGGAANINKALHVFHKQLKENDYDAKANALQKIVFV